MSKPNRSTIVNSFLDNRVVTVKFTKLDGTTRELRCTKRLDMVPSEQLPKGNSHASSPDVLKVFALCCNGWRSFRYDSVISITPFLD